MCQKLCSTENMCITCLQCLTRSISELLFSILHCVLAKYSIHTIIHNTTSLFIYAVKTQHPAILDILYIISIYLIDLTLLKHLFLLLIANNILTMVNVTIYSILLLLLLGKNLLVSTVKHGDEGKLY